MLPLISSTSAGSSLDSLVLPIQFNSSFGVWDSRSNAYNKRDILHLGKQGIILLAKTIRESVHTKLVTSRSYSSTLTSHPRAQQARSPG